MDRFPKQQTYDRSPGPAIGAAADGLAQGVVYTAVIQSAVVAGMVAVTLPALHLSETFQAHIKPDANCSVGETCLVEFDEFKTPWVITGNWAYPNTAALEITVSALGVAVGVIESSLAPSVWVAPTFINSAANAGGAFLTAGYRHTGTHTELRGSVKPGATEKALFVLPEALRPAATIGLTVETSSAPFTTGITINAAGEVIPFFTNAFTRISLDGLSFPLT